MAISTRLSDHGCNEFSKIILFGGCPKKRTEQDGGSYCWAIFHSENIKAEWWSIEKLNSWPGKQAKIKKRHVDTVGALERG